MIPDTEARFRPWPGIIEAYRDRLPVSDTTPVITLREGGTPLLPAPYLSERVEARVLLKYEGPNPTGSFKDRGMTLAISKAVEEGSKAVICASTGNTSASAAAYAARAGLVCGASSPRGTSPWASWPRPSSTGPRSSRSGATSTRRSPWSGSWPPATPSRW